MHIIQDLIQFDPVANYKLKNKLTNITNKRIRNAYLFDKHLSSIDEVSTVKRKKYLKEVFHLYKLNVKHSRDQLIRFLNKNGIDAKVHYPKPIHLQPAANFLKYKKGDFPMQKKCKYTLSLPVHEFINVKQIKFTANKIKISIKNLSEQNISNLVVNSNKMFGI